MFRKFISDESGAVTVDWVVMTAAVTGIGVATTAAVSTGMENLSSDVDTQLSSQVITTSFGLNDGKKTKWSGKSAKDYVAMGAEKAPGNNGAIYHWAQKAAAEDAPEGYNFEKPLMDKESGNVVYISNDGKNFSIGGEVHPVSGYKGSLVEFSA